MSEIACLLCPSLEETYHLINAGIRWFENLQVCTILDFKNQYLYKKNKATTIPMNSFSTVLILKKWKFHFLSKQIILLFAGGSEDRHDDRRREERDHLGQPLQHAVPRRQARHC